MLNQVSLQGRLTRDVEINPTNERPIAHFTLASDRDFKNKNGDRDTDFIRCVAFGKTAENFANFFKKGNMAIVTGRWETGSYQNQEGNTVYTNELVINTFNFCESAQKEPQPATNSGQYNPQPQSTNDQDLASLESNMPPQNKQGEMPLDDVPFDHSKDNLGDVAF